MEMDPSILVKDEEQKQERKLVDFGEGFTGETPCDIMNSNSPTRLASVAKVVEKDEETTEAQEGEETVGVANIESTGGSGSKTAGNIAENLDTNNIPNMTKQEIIAAIPNNWNCTEHNGFVHIKDEKGNMRIRIDPADKKTQYPHVHVYDNNGKLLDKFGNVVGRKSPDGHIPYKH